MLKTLDRYLLKELFVPFLLALATLTFVVLVHQILKLMDLLINKGIGLSNIVKAFFFVLPSFFLITIPMAVLIASLVAFNRLSFDHELVALKSLGIGFGRLLRPLLFFSVGATIFTLFLALIAEPLGGRAFKELTQRVIQQRASIGLTEGTFNTLSDEIMIYVSSMPTYNELKGVLVSDLRRPEEPLLIVARRGTIASDPDKNTLLLTLKDGSLHHRPRDPKLYRRMSFAQYELSIDLSQFFQEATSPSVVLSHRELVEQVNKTGGKDIRALRSLEEFYKNFAFASASLLLGLIGAPLGMMAGRASRFSGFATAVGLIALYYVLSIVGDFLVSGRYASPLLGAILPNLVLLPPMLVLVRAALRERFL